MLLPNCSPHPFGNIPDHQMQQLWGHMGVNWTMFTQMYASEILRRTWDRPETPCHPQNQSSHLKGACYMVSRSGFLKGLLSNFELSDMHTNTSKSGCTVMSRLELKSPPTITEFMHHRILFWYETQVMDEGVPFDWSCPLNPEKLSHWAQVTLSSSTGIKRATKNQTSKSPVTLYHVAHKRNNTDISP